MIRKQMVVLEYVTPEIEAILFENCNVVCASDDGTEGVGEIDGDW